MVSKIPADIREKATDVARRWYHEEWEPDHYIQQELVDDIARALMAERERCAVIAEDLRADLDESITWHAMQIAAAIRAG